MTDPRGPDDFSLETHGHPAFYSWEHLEEGLVCWWCGTADGSVFICIERSPFVSCGTCGMSGPYGNTPAEAVAAWKRGPALPCRYVVEGYDQYYPSGGSCDFASAFSKAEDAEAFRLTLPEEYTSVLDLLALAQGRSWLKPHGEDTDA